MAVRVVVEDGRRGLSFRAPGEWVPALIAACCSMPKTVDDYLQRLDTYRRGLAETIALSLMARNTHRLGGSAELAAEEGPPEAVRVWLDRPGEAGLLHIDLGRRTVTAGGAAQGPAARRGDVEVLHGETPTGRRVTFVLPPGWTLHAENIP